MCSKPRSLNGVPLCLEVTEGTLMTDAERCRETLLELRRIGARIAIDDFGAGYSSLSYLDRLPIDVVKIDISFVSRLARETGSAAIVRAIIDLAHALGMQTIAEGIEHEDTYQRLGQLGCDSAQGFFIAPALPPQAFIEWVGAPRSRPSVPRCG